MSPLNKLASYDRATERLPMRMPVRVAGRSGHICGRSFVHERYDVEFGDNSIMHGLPRDLLEPDWTELRK